VVGPFHGGCMCKAVRYEVTAEPFAVMDYHCRDCQCAPVGSHTRAVRQGVDEVRHRRGRLGRGMPPQNGVRPIGIEKQSTGSVDVPQHVRNDVDGPVVRSANGPLCVDPSEEVRGV
jgi:hypothetical protein